MSRKDWEVVIGLEIHVQLATQSKIFSGASTAFGASPNAQASLIDLGMPGVLPVVNVKVYEKAVTFGLGIGAKINHTSTFDRKNYFYPDLPKGYQITQLAAPIIAEGEIDILLPDGRSKKIRITRAHLEEDAGKSLHEDYHGMTGIDLNRAGTPLLEIVSEPDMRSATEAVAYAKAIHHMVSYLGVSDGDMSQGSMRFDANVSLRPTGSTELGTRTETKNLNSFRFLEGAIEYEIHRQMERLETGQRIIQETRLYDPDRDETRPMRSKETATDYRYFPEPDLLPVQIDAAYIEAIRAKLPELPGDKRQRYLSEYQLTEEDAVLLTSSLALASFFEETATVSQDPRLAANWVKGDLMGMLNKNQQNINESPVSALQLGHIILRIKDNTISGKIAKQVFEALWQNPRATVDSIIDDQGLRQVSDSSSLAPLVDSIIAANPKQVAQYKEGKTKLLGFFVGQVMKETQGKANPQQLNTLVKSKLEKS